MQTNPPISRISEDRFFPCQQMTARARNGAVDAIATHDTATIVYRYLGNRHLQQGFRRNAILGAIAGVSLAPIAGLVYSGINTDNSLRCRASKRACKDALNKILPPPLFAELRKFRHGADPYIELLQKNNIDTTRLEQERKRSARTRRKAEEAAANVAHCKKP